MGLLATADWRLTLPIVAWSCCYATLLATFVPRMRERSRAVSEMRSQLTGRVVDSYTNILTVKLFARARDEDAFVREAVDDHTAAFRRQTAHVHRLHHHAGADECEPRGWHRRGGDPALARRPHRGGRGGDGDADVLADHQHGRLGRAERDQHLREHGHRAGWHAFDRACRGRCRTRRARPPRCAYRGAIRFENVASITAARARRGVLRGIDLTIAPGERVGLVGRVGRRQVDAGEPAAAILRVERGRILIDGQDIAGVTQESLRGQIGMVTQDTSLLHRSIRDNIRYGRPEATEADDGDAARRADAHEFIVGLEDGTAAPGYDAHVGERGVKLSGGQRQRIAIARVILKDAPILVLDEATSALDSEVEAAIQERLDELMAGAR